MAFIKKELAYRKLRHELFSNGWTSKTISEKLKYKRSTIKLFLAGHNQTENLINAFHKTFGFRKTFLRTGRGEMFCKKYNIEYNANDIKPIILEKSINDISKTHHAKKGRPVLTKVVDVKKERVVAEIINDLQQKRVSLEQISNDTGFSVSYIALSFKKRKFSVKFMMKLAKTYGYSPNYILGYDGLCT